MRQSASEKPLSPTSVTFLVVASMIGAGVYTTSGFAIADLGDARLVMVAWAIGGLIAICGAVSYGLLAHQIAENGGEYLYLSRRFHPAAGFVAGWISIVAGFTGAGALAALTFEAYLFPAETDLAAGLLLQSEPSAGESSAGGFFPRGSVAVALTATWTMLHCFRIGPGRIGQNILVAVKLGLIVVFVGVSLVHIDKWQGLDSLAAALPTPDRPGPSHLWLAMAGTLTWISLSYSGFNAAIYIAGESSGGGSSVSRSMILATAVVTGFYLMINAVFVFGPPYQIIAGKQDIAAIAAQWIGGDQLAILVRGIICIGLASSVSATLMAGPRVYAKMASDGLLPACFDSPNPPPTGSVVVQGIAIMVMILSTRLQSLLSYLSLTLAISAAVTIALCCYRDLSFRRGWIVLFRSVAVGVYVAGTLLSATIAGIHRPWEAVTSIATIAIGLAIYFLLPNRRIRDA